MIRPKRGYALATILILLGVCMFGAAALVTISILESKIARSQLEGTVAYYAAEAGVTDAVWRLNTNSTYRTALDAGTLNVTYSATNQPATGQGFTVTMQTGAQGAGYATINVTGTSNNGNFTSQRKVESSVFLGGGVPTIGTNAILSGGSATITNGGSSLTFTGGDFFSRGSVTINQATVTGAGRYIQAVGSYSANNSTVTVAGVKASNFPPAPTDITVPGYNFAQYNTLPTNRCTSGQYAAQTQLRCTAAQFQSLIGSSNNFTFPNQVVYISNALTLNSWVRNKTLNFNGLIVVNGAVNVTGAATNFTMNVADPGTHRSGIMVAGNFTNSSGIWNFNGIMYASGSISFNNPSPINVNCAVVSGGSLSVNTGSAFTITFNSDCAGAILGEDTTNTAVQVLHWEEEY